MLLQIIQSGLGFGSFFPFIIHIQRDKLHFGPHGKNEESKRKEAFLTYKSSNTYKHGPWVILCKGNC